MKKDKSKRAILYLNIIWVILFGLTTIIVIGGGCGSNKGNGDSKKTETNEPITSESQFIYNYGTTNTSGEWQTYSPSLGGNINVVAYDENTNNSIVNLNVDYIENKNSGITVVCVTDPNNLYQTAVFEGSLYDVVAQKKYKK